jgi:prephenate dehydratase
MGGIAFQGERGAFSEETAVALFPDRPLLPQASFADCFAAVLSGAADLAVVAVENTTAYTVDETYQLLLEYQGKIFPRGEYDLRVRHCLMALPGQSLQHIHTVQSHPQALAQCRAYLEQLDVQTVPVYDTAGSAKLIRVGDLAGVAGIASRRAAAIYDLDLLAENIQTNKENFTRFLVIGSEPTPPLGGGKTSIVFVLPDRPGSLFRAMAAFAIHEVNVSRLESRPMQGRTWEYLFHANVQGDQHEPDVAAALSALERCTTTLKIIGSYPVLTAAG